MKRKGVLVFLWSCTSFVLAALSFAFVIAVAMIDARLFGPGCFTESSLIEIVQELELFAAAILFCALGNLRRKRLFLLAAGLIACMLIRELDALFDMVWHGCWFYAALACAGIFLAAGLRRGLQAPLQEMEGFTRGPAFAVLFAGLVVVLVVSRLLGMQAFWDAALAADFPYKLKRIIEETLELWGYTLILSSALLYLIAPQKEPGP